MKRSVKNYKRIVVKIGSSLLYAKEVRAEGVAFALEDLGHEIVELIRQGKEVVLVSSGAIAAGMRALKLKMRPKDISSLQATAAVGQHLLMSQYRNFFDKKGMHCAQVLLTWEDFDDRRRYLNAKNTLLTILKLKCVPIVNENDTVSTDEIKFGDNDTLSARVAGLISADLLVILSDVDGLLDRANNRVPRVNRITGEIKALACPTNKKSCVGGMITKLEAAQIAQHSGIPCVIANGNKKGILAAVVRDPQGNGTLFCNRQGLCERKRWIAFGTLPKGKIIVDDGAKYALLNKKSLLSVGITGLEGAFNNGDIVSVADTANNTFARGKAGVSRKELDKIKGRRFDKEIIHRDNIVIL